MSATSHHFNVHRIPTYANPRGNYGEIINSFRNEAEAIRCAKGQHKACGDHYAVSRDGLVTVFHTGDVAGARAGIIEALGGMNAEAV